MNWRVVGCLTLLAIAIPDQMRAQETRPHERLTVSLPGRSWAVVIDSPGFAVEIEDRKADGRQYLLANNSKTGLVISVTLEESREGADSKTCPDFLRKRVESISKLGVADVKASQIGSMAVIEYLLPKPQGIPLQQKNFAACTAQEDVYIDIHLSKVMFQPADESLFTDILNRVRITDRTEMEASVSSGPPAAALPGSGATSLDYFREGSRYYVANDFRNAIGPYQKALDLEKQQPKLSTSLWRALVDNLGMAYGVTGDLDLAEQTFNYGMSKDPSYPMFYYNLGCVYAERNDMGKAMEFLRKAFALKANAIRGEGMPDPRKDDSFQRFMSNESFRKLVDSLVAPAN